MSTRVFHALMFLGWLALAGGARAQSYSVSYEQLGLWEMGLVDTDEDEIPDTPFYYIAWNAKAGRTYFIQMSDDMMNWTMVPAIEAGSGQYAYWAAAMTAERRFLRLLYTDAAAPQGALGSDFDGDGLSNETEVMIQGTNPLNADTDGDSFSDGLEITYLSSPLSAASQPPYELEITRGQGQAALAGTPLFQKLTVRVRQAGTLRTGVPVSFAVTTGAGTFGLDGTGGDSTSITTNAAGEAAVVFLTDEESVGAGVITAQASMGWNAVFNYVTLAPGSGGAGGGGNAGGASWANYFRLEHRSATGNFTDETGTREMKTVPFIFEWDGEAWISDGPDLGFQWTQSTGSSVPLEGTHDGGVTYGDSTVVDKDSASAVTQAVNAVASPGPNEGWMPALSASGVFAASQTEIERTEGGIAEPPPPPEPPEGTPDGYRVTVNVSGTTDLIEGSGLSQSAGEWRLVWADFADPTETATMSFVVVKETKEEGEETFTEDSTTVETITLPPSQSHSSPLKANPQPAGAGVVKQERANGIELLQPKLVPSPLSPDPILASDIRLCRWRDAFGANFQAFDPAFITTDPDRVVVRFPAGMVDPGSPQVEVKVSGISDVPGVTSDSSTLTLTAAGGGLETPPMIFVADSQDDTSFNGNTSEDQTLVASPEATITVKFRPKGQAADIERQVGKIVKPRRTVTVALHRFSETGAADGDKEATIEDHFKYARLFYRQIGIDLKKSGNIQNHAYPAAIWSLTTGIGHAMNGNDRTPANATPSNKNLFDYLDSLSGSGSTIHVYWVDSIGVYTPTGREAFGGIGGEAELPGNTALMTMLVTDVGRIVTAHEIGHCLGLEHPLPANDSEYRLMHPSPPQWKGTHEEGKRFYWGEALFPNQ